ncbi:MAG: hypothetical protein KatS3mg113_0722 [Planctomycetaceae bacterium]|nr:MAG: hypothetical protein KatS3mg113_0722 [Planctomycetaceae bacterium]
MDTILHGYEVNAPTWFYLSLLLILAVFFRFQRIWSLRNLDLVLLLLLSPGLLIVQATGVASPIGYVWLFVVSGILWLRMLCDPMWIRRPRLDPNLNSAGLAFLMASAFAFQVANILTRDPHANTMAAVQQADRLLKGESGQPVAMHEARDKPTAVPGPASSLLVSPVLPLTGGVYELAARWLAVLAHLSVTAGLIVLGRLHYRDWNQGLAMATLYLLLPCTAYDVSRVTHLLPAALILWAVVLSHSSLAAGLLLGLACGSLFFPWFLVPIWAAYYYRRRALLKFSLALSSVAAILVLTLWLSAQDGPTLQRQLLGSIDWSALKFAGGNGQGFWSLYDAAYRMPVFTLFTIILVMQTIWPLEKHPEHLLAQSATTVIATQFWYPHEGGVYILWYLPLVIAVVFRPRWRHNGSETNSALSHVSTTVSSFSPERSTAIVSFEQARWSSSLRIPQLAEPHRREHVP